MIGYVTLGTNNFEEAARFYDELLGSIGAGRFMDGLQASKLTDWLNTKGK